MRSSNAGVNLSALLELDPSFLNQTQVRVFSWFDKSLLPLMVITEVIAIYFIQDSVISNLKKWVLSVVAFLGGIAFIWYWIIDGRLYWWLKQISMFKSAEEKALIRTKTAIYERLRIIETERIIFDPATGREQMLDGLGIGNLVGELAMDDLLKTSCR